MSDDVLWDRHPEAGTAELLRATTAAFALIAASDGSIDDAEKTRFAEAVTSSKVFADVDTSGLQALLDTWCQQLLTNYDGVIGDIEAAVKIIEAGSAPAAVVLAAAMIAVVADEELEDREEVALKQLSDWLEMDAS